ncbi:hypothetical protein [Priestia megaterium]|uniref:hypothetical protein n=1 Tax=Priestia megaterium TaxID=1404 RepID=UPI0011B4B018|nr:hypothetical protein [Priestia megaterium]QDZ88695.1 hypothetical protein D0441_31145 [Priestia megaterium]
MKIGEILELAKSKPLADIAKENLSIGKDKARLALREAGCYSKNGVKGWFYDGEESVLEQSIYDFVDKPRLKKRNASIEKANESVKNSVTNVNASESEGAELVDSELLSIIRTITNNETAVTHEDVIKSPKTNVSMDSIDLLLAQNDNESTERVYRGFYWDKEVISFLDGIKHGNKSDLMNEIVKTVLRAKGLLW